MNWTIKMEFETEDKKQIMAVIQINLWSNFGWTSC